MYTFVFTGRILNTGLFLIFIWVWDFIVQLWKSGLQTLPFAANLLCSVPACSFESETSWVWVGFSPWDSNTSTRQFRLCKITSFLLLLLLLWETTYLPLCASAIPSRLRKSTWTRSILYPESCWQCKSSHFLKHVKVNFDRFQFLLKPVLLTVIGRK